MKERKVIKNPPWALNLTQRRFEALILLTSYFSWMKCITWVGSQDLYWFCLNFLFVFFPCWLVGFRIFIWRKTEKNITMALLPRHRFPVCVHCDLDLGDITLGQGHDTPLGHGQQLCEILSRSNLAMRSYGPYKDFGYVCTVTLTLEIWPWVKVMTHPWVMDNNCVKLYPDRTREYEVMAQIRCEQMDRQTNRQTGGFLLTP